MGLLDHLGGLTGRLDGGPANPKAALVEGVLGMLVHGNEPGGLGGSGGLGGLGGLLQRFQSAGLGPEVASWVGSGANASVSAGQIKQALGDGPLRALAEHAGLDEDQAAAHQSTLLPALVDRLTPDGEIPPAGIPASGLAGTFESLGHLFTSG